MRVSRALIPVLFVLALSPTVPVQAGGLYSNEFATPESGTAGVGAEAIADGASTAIPFYNPAGMTRLEGHHLLVGGGVLLSSIEFDLDPAATTTGGNGGEAGGGIPLLSAAYVHSISDRLKFGASLFALAGAVLDYDDDWAGRKQVQEVGIIALSLSTQIAYRIGDRNSVGGGFTTTFSALSMDVEGLFPGSRITIDGDDTQVAFNLSWLFEASEKTRFGLTYQSETEFDYSGDVERNPGSLTAPVDLDMALGQFLRIGAYHDINDRWAFLGTVGWEDWGALDSQLISVGSVGSATLDRNWEDTYRYGAGFHYRISDPWLFQFGINYDTSPVSAADRTADLPVDRQLRYGVGFRREKSDRFGFAANLVYADLGDAAIDSSAGLAQLVGDYSSNDYIAASFSANWKFGQ